MKSDPNLCLTPCRGLYADVYKGKENITEITEEYGKLLSQYDDYKNGFHEDHPDSSRCIFVDFNVLYKYEIEI
jgi:hypothetical protein